MNNPDQVVQSAVSALLHIAKTNDPAGFRAYFMGAFVANVLGNLPEAYWQQFKNCAPCGEAMCNCHLLGAQVMPALEAIRRDHLEHCPKSLSE